MSSAYRSIPEGAAKFNGFEKDRFCFLQTQVGTQPKAETHTTEAWRLDLDVLELKCLDHFDRVGSISFAKESGSRVIGVESKSSIWLDVEQTAHTILC